MKRYTIYMQPLAAAGELSCFFVTLTMMDAPGLPAVEPVVDSGRVGLWLVENLVAHGFGGKVATWVEHTPPNVVFSTSGSWCARGSWGAWCSGAHRHRQLARLSLHFDIQGLRRRLPKHAKAAFRLRSGDNIIPKLFKQNHFCSLSLSLSLSAPYFLPPQILRLSRLYFPRGRKPKAFIFFIPFFFFISSSFSERKDMASAVFSNSMSPSAAVFSRTHLSVPANKDFPLEFSPYFHYNCHLRSRRRTGNKKCLTKVRAVTAAVPPAEAPTSAPAPAQQKKNLRILVAGGGIGGLVFALAAKKKGFDVVVFEKDLSAVRGEGQYRGPIQIQSNALAALEAIDVDVADEIMRVGCVTGDRINGLVDGVSGTWYVKFDTFTPAVERGLPVTRVISRMTLQQILARAVGDDIIINGSNVVNFEDVGDKVNVILENGERFEGDVLVGADGIWSKVRKNLFGLSDAVYSGYTCYTGIADFVPADINSVGYRVFLGHKQYFVSSDVGAGKMQWYAFHKEAPGGVDSPSGKKERLLKIFEGWCDNVTDLLLATEEDAILRRDIYDRKPILTWGKGHVTLLGDSVHAMQPNMGQGGCMAIEDGYQLAMELDKAWQKSSESGTPIDINSSLRSYENSRRLRVAIIHGMARMAALMASTYKAYLGVGLGPLSFLTKFRIPHPGRVGGRVFIDKAMPLMLSWVLGGNSSKLEGRSPSCRLSDKASDQLRTWFEDDDALERAIDGEWYLIPCGQDNDASQLICLNRDEKTSCIIGSIPHGDASGTSITIRSPQVSEMHARLSYKDGAFYVTDLQSEHGTWIADIEEKRYRVPPNFPARIHPSDAIEIGSQKVAFRVKVMKSSLKSAEDGVLQAA